VRHRRRLRGAWLPDGRAISLRERREADLFYADLLGRSPTPLPDEAPAEWGWWWWGAAAERKKKVNAFFTLLKTDVKSVGLDLTSVQLLDMLDHRQHDKLEMFNAWTNSATEIYVNFDKIEELAAQLKPVRSVRNARRMAELVYATLFIRHELNHIAQFRDPAKGPPTLSATPYKQMCEYEKEAHGKDAAWTKANRARLNAVGLTDAVIDSLPDENEISKDFARIASLDTEAKRKDEMIKKDYLPPHNNMADLYKAQ
jgi:hypothetical protein